MRWGKLSRWGKGTLWGAAIKVTSALEAPGRFYLLTGSVEVNTVRAAVRLNGFATRALPLGPEERPTFSIFLDLKNGPNRVVIVTTGPSTTKEFIVTRTARPSNAATVRDNIGRWLRTDA